MSLSNPSPPPSGGSAKTGANDNGPRGIVYHPNVAQGSVDWHELRRGMLLSLIHI